MCLRFREFLNSGINYIVYIKITISSNTPVKQRFTFADGSHNILEVTEIIFVAGGCQSYLWPETTELVSGQNNDH